MSTSCDVKNLVAGSIKTIEGIGLELQPGATSSDCSIRLTSYCVTWERTKRFSRGSEKIIDYIACPNTVWRIKYVRFVNANSIDVQVCMDVEEDAPPIPPPDEGEPIDYEKIEGDTRDIAVAVEESIVSEIAEIGGVIAGVATSVTSMNDGLTGQVATFSSEVKGLVGKLSDGLGNKVAGALEAVTGGIMGVSDKIDGLQFPTIENIKDAFLDLCGDLALALWDTILDKIEERYPDDEEEAD